MKWIAACLALAVMLAASASSAVGRDDAEVFLPASVSEAWTRYLAAMEAGDTQAAGDAILEAHRAAEAESVDSETRAILADSAGQFAYVRRQFPEARAMLGLAASLYGSMGERHTNSQVRVLTLVADSHLNEDDFRQALSGVDQVLQAAGPSGVDAARDRDIAAALVVRARAHWRQNALSPAGQAAKEALDVMELHGFESFSTSGLMAFYAGVERSLSRRDYDSAWWFAVADHLFREQGHGGNLMSVADIWSRYARNRLSTHQRRQLIAQLSQAGLISPAQLATAEAESDRSEAAETAEPDPLNRDARPINRRAPRYPDRAAAAGVDGVALVTFTVTAEGRVKDAEVVFSAPHTMFGDEALRAVNSWRYEPKLVDGAPVDREGVQTTFEFIMDREAR